MPLFVCSGCGCVENTALCEYWYTTGVEKKPPVCSECDPEIGEWHGKFEKRSAVGMLWGKDGYVRHSEQVSAKKRKKYVEVTPEVLAEWIT